MGLWYMIEACKEIAAELLHDLARKTVGWLILGRECRRCKHYKTKMYGHGLGFMCTLEAYQHRKCECSINLKYFERE